MRILMLDNEFPPVGGGTGVINFHLMKELDALNVCCDLVSSSRSRNRYEQEAFAQFGRIFKVPVNNRNIHHSSNIELTRYAIRGLRQAYRLQRAQPYDVCLAFAGVPAGAIALVLKRLTGLPYILSLQGPDVPWYEQRYNYLYPVLIPFLKKIWQQAASVTAQSEENRRLARQTMPNLLIAVIPNGVETSVFAPSASRERRADHPLTILCAGRLIARKGQHHLLQAMSLLHQRGYAGRMRIVFVGTGDMESQLHELCQELDLQSHVVFAGFRDREQMPGYYREADLFVLPSYNEGMSVALLEAISAGLPVIVTNTGGTVELVHDNGLIVPWADPSALANAIETFLCDRQLCEVMGQRSRAIAQAFTWQAAANTYLDLFQQISQDNGSQRI
jgi:glycosyltransferase involved in cell wall biosynthesis